MQKIDYVIWVVAILIGLGLLWLIAEPIIWWTDKSEYRLYARVFLILFFVCTFAILRLYNSIVANTRFSIKLRETFVSLYRAIPPLERALKNVNSSLGNVRSSTDTLRREVSTNSDVINKVSERINRM